MRRSVHYGNNSEVLAPKVCKKNRCFFATNCFAKVKVEPEMINEHADKNFKIYVADD